jgi:hypothetical protein
VLTVACVLRSGGEYRPEHVQALREQVARWLPLAHDFVCLSDMGDGDPMWIPCPTPFRGWWAKMEMFAPGLFSGRVLYLDLDSVVVGDLSEIASYAGPFAMLSDFYRPERPASGVMAWDADSEQARAIWGAWIRDPQEHMYTYRGGGDQAFLRSVVGDGVDRLHDLYPGQLVSYKVHCKDGVPTGAKIVAAHGRPKPWDPEWRL